MLFRILLLLLLCSDPVLADQTQLEVIALKHRSLEEVLPALRPFVGRDGALSGMNGQLIVRATPVNLAQIHAILQRIDTLPRRLRIVVRQGDQSTAQEDGAEVFAQLRAGDVRLRVPAHGGTGATVAAGDARARVWSSRFGSDDDIVQQVQVLEGRQAFIRMGQSVPLRETTVLQSGSASRVVESTRYTDIGTGFYVLPRLSGDRVTLEINPQKERLVSDREPIIETRQALSTLTGRLGEWIELSGWSQDRSGSDSGWVYGTRRLSKDEWRIWVKVEELP